MFKKRQTFGEMYIATHGEVAGRNRIACLEARAKEALYEEKDFRRYENLCQERNNIARALGDIP